MLSDQNLHKTKKDMDVNVVGDQNCVKTGVLYKIHCKGDDEVGDSTLSVVPGKSRFIQTNTTSKFEREIARFDRPCYFKKPK